MHGQIDDFAVFGTALSAADVGRLFTGTLPSALGAATKPLAHWDFNDAAVVSPRPTLVVTRGAAGALTVQWTGGGTLEAATNIAGPWAPVTGAASPYTFTPAANQPLMFARVRVP